MINVLNLLLKTKDVFDYGLSYNEYIYFIQTCIKVFDNLIQTAK